MYIEIKKKPDNIAKFPDHEQITDRSGNPITRPEVIAEYKRIKAIPHKQRTAKEGIRLNNILKYGDNCPNKNKMRETQSKPPVNPDLKTLNSIRLKPKDEKSALKEAIENIYNGINPIQAIIQSGLTPRKFYLLIEKNEFSFEKIDYLHARECYAEFCLYKRERLEKQLLAGEIDSSTYRTIADDYKFLAMKFYPKMYGDRINIEANSTTTVTHTIDNQRIMQLNQMLSGGLLEDKRTVDAEFEEVDK